MSDRPDPPNWLVERPGLTALALASSLLALVVLLPYLQYVLFGVVLAYILLPVQRRLEAYVRPTIAALAVVAATLLVVLLPLIYVLSLAVGQSLRLVRSIRQGEIDVEMIESMLESNGYAVDLVALYESNQDRIATAVQEVTNGAIALLGSLPSMFIGLTVTLFVLFALLRDGERLVSWLRWVLPIEDDVLDELEAGLDRLMWASVVGNVAVAAIQSVMLGVGLLIAGVPAVIFLTVATFILTLLPLVGAFGIWIPATLYLVAMGRLSAGVAMFVYGLVVTFSDSYLRPALIGRSSAFNSAIVVVGIFGGLIVFGAVGLFIGPVVLGGAKLTLDCFARARTDDPIDGAAPDAGGLVTDAEGEADSSGADDDS
ncbi:AI-2E family transporter [Natrinema thermotolerans]|uniref:AI-2E family transporter n=1 Tax=Natrinema thermotolerans TaxID=121872 RepID=A0AAF0T5F7_9EURY|nr:AI-2E family transporter [Natrinema thermotolerans]QCC60316.1 AI-2E family transporter [Natrinema thermotolerans]QCC61225.1 AI-2E family transporter [Natrinema thermotolerans]WMT07339.1 AI-2E family transporter [Natrinema thermotolerans]